MFWLSVGVIALGVIALGVFVPDGKYRLVVMRSKTVALGTLPVDELTILEWKPLFSLKTFYFNVGEAQTIYHTHSFAAISLLLYGNYEEAFYDPATQREWSENRNRARFIYIASSRFHQITKSTGCRTIMLTGRWGDYYQEYNPTTKELVTSTHGRKEVLRGILPRCG